MLANAVTVSAGVNTLRWVLLVALLACGGNETTQPFVTGPYPEPAYSQSNPDHVLHVFEDWSAHTSINDIGTALRADGGPPWADAGIRTYGAVVAQTDSFGSVRYLSSNYGVDPPIPPHGTGLHAAGLHWYGGGSPANSFQGNVFDAQGDDNAVGGGKANRGFFLPGGAYLNKPAKAVVVYEWAVRQRGTNWYEGKEVDINAGASAGTGRSLFNTHDALMGWDNVPTTALVARYYSSGGNTPRLPGLPPSWSYIAPNHSQIQSALSVVTPSITVNYKQNRNWGTGPGQFSHGAAQVWPQNGDFNADLSGTGKPMWQAGWLYFKLRLTKQAPGQGHGNGRLEMWVGKRPGSLLKIMEYIGDVGAFDAGLVFVDPTGNSDQLSGQIGFWELLSRRYTGGAILDFGTIRIWSHSRP